MKKVIFVATVVKKHIMEFHIPYLKMLQEMGFETSVAARNDYADPSECSIPYCDHYYDIQFNRNPAHPENITAFNKLKALIDLNQYDIIHCHTPVGAFLTRLAAKDARSKGTKVIYTAHGFHFFKGAPVQNWLLYYPLEKYASKFTDVLITINQEDYQIAKTFSAKKVCYVPGVGIDMDKFCSTDADRSELRKRLGIENDRFVILSVGELNNNKNHRSIIKALSQLNDQRLLYIICGEGPCRTQLESLAEDLHIKDQVLFTGYTKNVRDYYFSADLFVFPSYREGLSLSLMEAISSRLPVICSEIRGNCDLVPDPDYRFDPGNQNQIIDKLNKAIHSNNQEEIRKNYENLKRFRLDNVTQMVKEIYEECMR